MLDLLTPNDADPTGEWYAFEKGAEKSGGDKDGSGFADVWKRTHFAWEYKGKKKNLVAAYNQLLQYRESLENPPVLVVCDLDRFEIHTNFTNTVKAVHRFELNDIERDPVDPLRLLRAVMTSPDELRPEVTPDQLTQLAARDFAKLASRLRDRDHEPHAVAHFLNRLLFCLFAEDAGLLPSGLVERIAEATRLDPPAFLSSLRDLFAKMSEKGGLFGVERIQWFDGGLFDTDEVLPLTTEEIDMIRWVGQMDWSQIEPAIFGTLFERGLDPSKRSQLGAHYTDRGSIERVVDPVVVAPLRREFEAMKEQVTALVEKGLSPTTTKAKIKTQSKPVREFQSFLERLRAVQVLDPACGSGNFLYVVLRSLKDLEREIILWGSETFGVTEFPRVGPQNVLGIELNEYAAELARVTIWIGEIQWMIHNGFGYLRDPILQPLGNIEKADALVRTNADRTIVEAQWPKAEFVIGNPPFLGGKLLRRGLGDDYVDTLFKVFKDRVPAEADFVTYWFEKAREAIKQGTVGRAGLLATQGIRGGANRRVLERIKDDGDIFMAWPDEPWIVEGAMVHVSIIGFDDGTETVRRIRSVPVPSINSNLSSGVDLTLARSLPANRGISFMGDTKGGPFDIPPDLAKKLLAEPNPDGRLNTDVVRPWVNGKDISGRPRNMWIIDFPPGMKIEKAALYEAPFEYVKRKVKPAREASRTTIDEWWSHERPRVDMRAALVNLERYIVTPRVSKHRLFVWRPVQTLADSATIVIARDNDFTFGLLHSRLHELWARGTGTQLREMESGFRYTPRTTFETFPFPLATEKQFDEIASIAEELNERREHWLQPPDIGGLALQDRTLTNLYNSPPTWLQHLHERLDAAVATAYGWPSNLSDQEVLERLLNLNHHRAKPGSSSE